MQVQEPLFLELICLRATVQELHTTAQELNRFMNLKNKLFLKFLRSSRTNDKFLNLIEIKYLS